jgi:PAS domain-containing protein
MEQERRRQPPPSDLAGYLRQLPALVLLDRLPIAVLGVGPLGDIAYANPACAELLGYIDGQTMTRLHLPDLLVGQSELTPSDCIAILETTDAIVHWNHAQDYLVRTKVSPTMMKRESDPLLLVSITDLTDWLWESKPVSGGQEPNGHSP